MKITSSAKHSESEVVFCLDRTKLSFAYADVIGKKITNSKNTNLEMCFFNPYLLLILEKIQYKSKNGVRMINC
jgi:hypothetical protein